MRNALRIYRVMLHYSGYLVFGLIFMLGFALFSGISITMAIPLFDYVFMADKPTIVYTNAEAFLSALFKEIHSFLHQNNHLDLSFSKEGIKTLGENVGNILSVTDPILLLWLISAAIIILVLLKNIFFYGNKLMFANLRGKTIKTVREMIFRKYLYQSLAFFGKHKIGDALVRMVSDVKIVSDMFVGALFRGLQDIFLLIIHTYIAILMNPRLFLYSLIVLPIFSYLVSYLGKKIKKYAKRLQNQSSNMFSKVEEILSSMPIVKAFVREKYEHNRFKVINNYYYKFWRKSIIYSSINEPISEINSTLMGIIVLLIGGKQVLTPGSDFSYGQFITFLLAMFSMLHPIKKLTKTYAQIRKALVSLDRISVILDQKSEILETKTGIDKAEFINKIEVKNISFGYLKDSYVLKNISFEIEKGEQVAIVGGSGSGKTTLVNLLTRMYNVREGQILIDGISINEIKLLSLRKLYGIVTQESILFSDTISNNISYGTLEKVTTDRIKKVAKIAYADEFIERMPLNYEEILDVRGGNLSGGQKQRLCIARAIIGDPPILIFDEATSALDTEAEQKVQMAIEQATKDRTVIVIAHRLSTILASNKIIVLDKGQLVGIGKHEDLLKNCERYKTLYKLQFADDAII